MKFHMMPDPWDDTIAEIEAAGHTHTSLDEAEFVLFNGQPDHFPDQLPESVGFIQCPFAGVDHILDVMRDSGVRWSNAAGLYDSTVAESTIGLLLAQLHAHKYTTLAKSWSNRDEVEANTHFLFEDSTVAIIGAGGIGAKLITMLSGFGPKIIAVNRSGRAVEGADQTVPIDNIDSVWGEADYFVLLTPLTEETRHMVNAETLGKMKPNAVVVNVGRGPLVNTDDLVEALANDVIAGAALDVTDPEPLPDGHPLWEERKCVITPHLANPPYSIRKRIAQRTIEAAAAFEAGEKMDSEVDLEAGY